LPLGKSAFYWRVRSRIEERNNEIPDFLPFEFGFDLALQLVIQVRNDDTLRWLERVYREDFNVGYLQDGHSLATGYGGEFMSFIDKVAAAAPSRPKSVLDIGCGGVYLLRLLRDKGFEVAGVDPSPVTVAKGAEHGIEIVTEFYPSASFSRRADLIYHHDVLEHVADPVGFLRAHHRNLNPGGRIVVAVPDCTENIRLGDISMLLHEHLNYFDLDSLGRTVRAAGFRPVFLEKSNHGGVLYCAAESVEGAKAEAGEGDWRKFERFLALSTRVLGRVRGLIQPFARDKPDSLGLYVPLRLLSYLSHMDVYEGVRFFDDESGIHRKYYDGFDIPIENFEDLCQRPVEHLLIASLAFGDRIAAKVEARLGKAVAITLWKDILASGAADSE
jgi:SAM-dependent methyltransferase